MTIFYSIILGLVEGLTEFLPISSTFHLLFASKLLNILQTDFVKVFEVFIQAGAILAVLILYFKEIVNNKSLITKIMVSFIPTGVIGFILYKVIKNIFFEDYVLMMAVFLIMGIIFLVIEKLVFDKKIKLEKSIKNINYPQTILIGAIQSLAVIPGVSRAGSVMVGMMAMGIKREESAKYSFVLAVPTILAASAYDLFKMREIVFSQASNLGILMIGFIVAFISALLAVNWFIGFLKKNSLIVFGIYRIALAIILLLIF